MDFFYKAIITTTVGIMPFVVGFVMNLFVDQAVLAQSLTDVKQQFLITVQRIDSRLDRIENKLDKK